MKTILSLVVTLAILPATPAQPPPTPVAVFPGSFTLTQVNTFESCLIVTAAGVQAPGMDFAAFPGVLTIFSPSTTFAYTCDGTVTGAAPGLLSYPLVTIEGTAMQPFALGLSVVPSGLPCGGAAMTPCMSGGSLFNNQITPYGRYHLTAPTVILDGISANHPNPGFLNAFGRYTLGGTLTVDTVANGGAEKRLAIQVIVADPAAAAGLTLSACLNVDQWVQQ